MSNPKAYNNFEEAGAYLSFKLKTFVIEQLEKDKLYLFKIVSENAHERYKLDKTVDEIVADYGVRIANGSAKDKKLTELVVGVLGYDSEIIR